MGDWLIGVHKGKFVTASDSDKYYFWENNEKIRRYGFFPTTTERVKFRPYFFILLPIPKEEATIAWRNKYLWRNGAEFLEKFGLYSAAYKYGTLGIPAYGRVEHGCFVVDTGSVLEKDINLLEKYWPDKKDRVCVLALRSEAWGVRTGTFFNFWLDNGQVVLRPCRYGGKYLVGKGVLLGLNADPGAGSMKRDEASAEINCPVSKVCVKFTDELLYGKREFFMVYRAVTTDLRADMPLALLKVSEINGALEQMFKGLGASFKAAFDEKRPIFLRGRDLSLDGTIVDYADAHTLAYNWGDDYEVRKVKKELFLILCSAALVSVWGKSVLSAFSSWKGDLLGFVRTFSRRRIVERYHTLFKCFAEGVGDAKIMGYFLELGSFAEAYKKDWLK